MARPDGLRLDSDVLHIFQVVSVQSLHPVYALRRAVHDADQLVPAVGGSPVLACMHAQHGGLERVMPLTSDSARSSQAHRIAAIACGAEQQSRLLWLVSGVVLIVGDARFEIRLPLLPQALQR